MFGSIIFWGCPATDIRDRGPFQGHRRYGFGLEDHPPTAPRGNENFINLFLGRGFCRGWPFPRLRRPSTELPLIILPSSSLRVSERVFNRAGKA